ncbi:MAG: hypothetical protein H6815_11675 [Phycisphaeraceae bacterium]|nr:hypothetical protein [Phycisphaerales bacterium]MCB9861098.1 hypothetical protein [Phycisphaeraceae bacterium]
MAARLNTRFVISIAVVLTFVAVVLLGVYYVVVLRSSSRIEKMGDKIANTPNATQEDLAKAIRLFGKAYRKDSSNASALRKMRDTMKRWTPESINEYSSKAVTEYPSILVALANLEPLNLDTQGERLKVQYERIRIFNRSAPEAWQYLEDEAIAVLVNFEENPAAPEGWEYFRRYRGISITKQLLLNAVVTQKQIDTALADLNAVQKAYPQDWESIQALISLIIQQGQSDANRGRIEKAQSAFEQAISLAQQLTRSAPSDPNALIQGALSYVHGQQELATNGLVLDEQEAAMRRVRTETQEYVQSVLTTVDGLSLTKLDPYTLESLIRLEGSILQTFDFTKEICRRAANDNATDGLILASAGSLLLRLGEQDEAISLFEKAISLPLPPISLEGVTLMSAKTEAYKGRVEAQAIKALKTEEDSSRSEAITRLDRYLAEAKENITQSELLLISEARVAFVKRDYARAWDAIHEYNQKTGDSSVDGIALEADILLADNKPQQAADRLRRAITLDRENVRYVIALADILSQNLRQFEDSYSLYQQARQSAPGSEYVQNRIMEVGALLGMERTGDPIVDILNAAYRLSIGIGTTEPDVDKAIELLRVSLKEQNNNPRLAAMLADILVQYKQDQDGATAVLQAALASHPDDQTLKEAIARSQITDPVERQVALIDSSSESDMTKMVQRYAVYSANKRTDLANSVLNELKANYPNEQITIELLFDKAVQESDFAEADRLAGIAEQRNLDRVGGKFYRAQVARAKKDNALALKILEDIIRNGTNNASHYLSLAEVKSELGDARGSLNALKDAYNLAPNDRRIAIKYIRQLRLDDRAAQSLALARSAQSLFSADPVFTDLWLRLEFELGDKELALRRREEIAKSRPDDLPNNLALAAMYITNKSYVQADTVLNRVNLSDALFEVTSLRAQMAADQGNTDGAVARYEEMLSKIPASDMDRLIQGHMAYAQFFTSISRVQDGIAVLDRLTKLTAEQQERIAVAKASMHQSIRQYDQVAELLAPIVENKTSLYSQAVPMYLAALSSLNRFDDADKVFASLSGPLTNDITTALMRVEMLVRAEQRVAALTEIGNIIQKFPRDNRAYIARARINMLQPETYPDALGDLDQALVLQEDSVDALTLRAAVNSQLGNLDNLIRDAERTTSVDPNRRGAYPGVVERLLEVNRTGDATEFVSRALEKWPDDAMLRVKMAEVFASHNAWREARTYAIDGYKVANKNANTTLSAQLLPFIVECSLQMDPPDISEAGSVVDRTDIQIESNPEMLMQRARTKHLRGRVEQAEADATQALRLVQSKPLLVLSLLEKYHSAFSNESDYVSSVARMRIDSFMSSDWARFITAQATSSIDADTTLRELDQLSQSANPEIQINALTEMNRILTENERHLEAVEIQRKLIELHEQNKNVLATGSLHNDIAYLLAKYGSGSQAELDEALQHAEQAAQLIPQNPNVLDTLGVVFMKRGDLESADGVLCTAFLYSTKGREVATTLAHIGQLRLAQGRNISQIRTWLDREVSQNPNLKERLKVELDELAAAGRE